MNPVIGLKLYKSFETERLLLRPTGVQDAPFLCDLMNTAQWLQYIGDRQINSISGASRYIRKNILPQLERLGFSAYTAIRKSDQTALGICGLYDREAVDGIDIGFAFLPKYQKQGYALEAASRLMRAANEDFGLTALYAVAREENIPSRQLLSKLGMHEGEKIHLSRDATPVLLYYFRFGE